MIINIKHFNAIPFEGESPSHYADRIGILYSSQVSDLHKKNLGQYFTPIEIAKYMATLVRFNKSKIKILDPGCGIGILSISLIELLVTENKNIKYIELVLFETDDLMITLVDKCFDYLRIWLKMNSIDFKLFLCKNDFTQHDSRIYDIDKITHDKYDIVISNPPYFKLAKNDTRFSIFVDHLDKQTNIYAIFVLISIQLLRPGGELIFIIPRSFCSGSYFKSFREIFFTNVELNYVHIFSSRRSSFKRDKVLQENIILRARRKYKLNNKSSKQFNNKAVTISSSIDILDIKNSKIKNHKLSDLVNLNSTQKILHLPISENDELIINIFKKWKGSLKSNNLEISTGPVVDFRNKQLITNKLLKNTCPLIYLHNVSSMKLTWPNENGYKGKFKGQYIVISNESIKYLLKNKNYVFLRRFSTKEDKKRLVAAPFFKSSIPYSQFIGVENHLNYIYHTKTELTKDQTIGLAAILNSRLFDLYFRTFNGNINVSATELRDFPLPNLSLIQTLGKKIISNNKKGLSYNTDTLISITLKLPLNLFTIDESENKRSSTNSK
ncbi:MAG TPA: N-6 DNA methylase [Saprospiraceae bacterium]|nr:N-6 DNA methylase [Saprospiraceae bacterium]